ncbi:3-coathanger stack domain-containing protein [Runella sp.]|uniref:3-coathanger stack domain-containing protein n=1 Tax=Runella sp. TaxID=1960881 RepID=UPI003D0BACD6
MANKIRINWVVLFYLTTLYTISANSQSISITSDNFYSLCAGSIISVPVSLSGSWEPDNKFVLKLKENSGPRDTTIYITASNTSSPLQFQLPKLYAEKNREWKLFSIASISSTNPVVVSNEKHFDVGLLPTIQLEKPMQAVDVFPISRFPNEYTNPGQGRYVGLKLYRGDGNVIGKLADSTLWYLGGEWGLSPNQTTVYQLVKIQNNCGIGKVLPPNTITVKVNPFKLKITSVYPKAICEDRKINVNIDYTGELNPEQAVIEIANIKGDTITQLPTTVMDARSFTTTLANSFSPGTYFVRIRSTVPDAATDFVPIYIKESQKIELNWPIEATNPIDYKKEVRLRINSIGASDSNRPLTLKLSDGTIVNNFNSYSGSSSGYYADVLLNPEKTHYYRVDSLITTCGISQEYTVSGERALIVKSDFYIENLSKLIYCESEKLKLKIKSSLLFTNNTVFTAKLHLSNGTVLSLPTTRISSDSLEFTIPVASFFESTAFYFQLQLESNSPTALSSLYWQQINVTQKPVPVTAWATTPLTNPGNGYLFFLFKGGSPASLIFTDGQRDDTVSVFSITNEHTREILLNPLIVQTTSFRWKSIENSCGKTENFPVPEVTITVANTAQKNIFIIKSPKQVCLGGTYTIEIKTAGTFSTEDEYLVRLVRYINYVPVVYEIGRGRSKILSIQIPTNVPVSADNNFCKFVVSSVQTEADNLPTAFREASSYITVNQTASLFVNTFDLNRNSILSKTVDLLKGESVPLIIHSSTSNSNEPYNVKINSTWYNYAAYVNNNSGMVNGLYINIKPSNDTLLILNALENICGVTSLNDTVKIKVRPYRIQTALVEAGIRCQQSIVDVMFSIEGNPQNVPTDYKVYFRPIAPYAQKYPDSLRFEAPVVTKRPFHYTVQIPDMPYEGGFGVEVEPLSNEGHFAKNYRLPQIFIYKRHQVKLTASDGASILWVDGSNSSVYLKAETLNSNTPRWDGKTVVNPTTFGGTTIQAYTKVTPIWASSTPGNVYTLADIESVCGYGQAIGEVHVKRCYGDVNPGYIYSDSNEYYSGSTIKSGAPVIKNNTLFSAKESIELTPGFKTEGQTLFSAEIKGCEVTKP